MRMGAVVEATKCFTDKDINGLMEFQQIIIDNSAMWLNALDDLGRVTHWNRAAEEISGYPREEVLGRTDIFDMLYPDPNYRTAIFARAMDIIQQGFKLENFETTITCKDGTQKILSWNSHNLTNQQGEVIGSIALAKDVTEAREAQRKLELALEEAKAGIRAKDRFIASISHEIRSPMNAIVGMMTMLERTVLNEVQKEYINIARQASRSLLKSIDDLLDVAKLATGHYCVQSVPCELSGLLHDVTEMLRIEAGRKGLELRLELSPDLPGCVMLDPERLQQVIINLTNNAVKFTDQGEIVVSASVSTDGARLLFSVRDTGIGVADDKLGDIFKPFIQADGSITKRFGGLGLGLSIVGQLIELMGGRIWVESTPGVGSTFFFELSLQACAAQPVALDAAMEKVVSRQRLHVLLAEDSPLNAMVIQHYFSEFDHQLELVENGVEAVDKVRHQAFDLILMDIQMPVKDGLTAVAEIRGIETALKRAPSHIAALSAFASQQEKERGFAAGCNDYLVKPLEHEQLVALLDKVTALKSAR